jgi:hypothetical protein
MRRKQSARIRHRALHLPANEYSGGNLPLFHRKVARFAHGPRTIFRRKLRRRANITLHSRVPLLAGHRKQIWRFWLTRR